MKYGNRKMIVDGIKFDSKLEACRYQELKLMQRAGVISDLKLQVKYELIPAQKIDGKVAERACSYVADFVYYDNQLKQQVVEDTKGMKTKDYVLKRK